MLFATGIFPVCSRFCLLFFRVLYILQKCRIRYRIFRANFCNFPLASKNLSTLGLQNLVTGAKYTFYVLRLYILLTEDLFTRPICNNYSRQWHNFSLINAPHELSGARFSRNRKKFERMRRSFWIVTLRNKSIR